MTPQTLNEFDRLELLRRVCRRFVRSLHKDLNELLSETWIATRYLDNPRHIAHKAKQHLIDLYRKELRRYMERIPQSLEIYETVLGPVSDTASDLSELIDRAQLDEEERLILYRYYFKEETQKDISRSLGVSRVRVSQRLSEILLKLKETLE